MVHDGGRIVLPHDAVSFLLHVESHLPRLVDIPLRHPFQLGQPASHVGSLGVVPLALQDRITLAPEKLSELNSQLVRAETKRKELETLSQQIQRINMKDAETIPAIASDPTLQSLRSQILNAEQRIEDLSKKFGKKHPSMIKKGIAYFCRI